MSLLEDDAEHRRCLQDAAIINIRAHMRQLFATLILFQTPSDINALFTEFQEDMADDYVRHDQLQNCNTTFQQQHIHICLADIQNNLHIHGKSLQDFPEMSQLPANYAPSPQADDEINVEQERQQAQQMLEQLNPEQLHTLNTVSTPSRHTQQTTVSFSTVQQELAKPSCTTHWYTISKLPDTKSNA
eukprot:gene18469-biopygen15557